METRRETISGIIPMRVIGLTGSIGTGKSTAAGMLRKLGARVIDADEIVHELLNDPSIIHQVVKHFGQDVLLKGKVHRAVLADIIFRNKAKRRVLERILHPRVLRIMRQRINAKQQGRSQVVVLEVPLLFETGFNRLCATTIVVKTRKEVQIERASKKLGISKEGVKRRINAQMPLQEKIRRADIIIDNNGTKKQTQNQIIKIWRRILARQ